LNDGRDGWFGEVFRIPGVAGEKERPRSQTLSSRAQHINRSLWSQGTGDSCKATVFHGKMRDCDDSSGI